MLGPLSASPSACHHSGLHEVHGPIASGAQLFLWPLFVVSLSVSPPFPSPCLLVHHFLSMSRTRAGDLALHPAWPLSALHFHMPPSAGLSLPIPSALNLFCVLSVSLFLSLSPSLSFTYFLEPRSLPSTSKTGFCFYKFMKDCTFN